MDDVYVLNVHLIKYWVGNTVAQSVYNVDNLRVICLLFYNAWKKKAFRRLDFAIWHNVDNVLCNWVFHSMFFSIDNSRKIKAHHLNKIKLHLTKYGSRVLSNNFVSKISKVLHWQTDRGDKPFSW